MGESAAYLGRSISYPSNASRELNEGDPLKALTDSISFGRFMHEPLAWEKWSSFSHNRRLEEAKSLSKPGSVAQKKAYFEAYYKKKAAVKEAAKIDEAAATQVESAHESQSRCPTSLPNEYKNSDEAVDEESEGVASADTSGNDSSFENSLVTQHVSLDEHEEMCASVADISEVNSSSDKRSPVIQGASSIGLHKEDENNHLVLEKEEVKDASVDHGVHSADTNSFSSSLDKKCTEVFNTEENEGTMVQHNLTNDKNAQVKNFEELGNSKEQEKDTFIQGDKLTAKKTVVHEIAFSRSKKDQAQSTKPLSRARASKIPLPPAKCTISGKLNNVAPVEKKCIRKPADKKKSANTLHMSIDISSGAAPKSKSLVFQSIENTKFNTISNQKSNDSSARLRGLTTASVSGKSKKPLITPRSEEMRSRRLLSKSNSVLIMNSKNQTLSAESLNSSAVRSSKARPSLLSCPFKFRTEERAIKRKQKLEENVKTEAKKTHLQARLKVKVAYNPKILQRSTPFEAKPVEELDNGSTKQTKMIPVPPPQPPKPEGTRFKAKPVEELDNGLTKQMKKIPVLPPKPPNTEGTRFKAKPVEELDIGLTKQMKKIPVPSPQPPKPERKQIASTMREASIRPPQRTSTTKDSSRHLLNRHTHKRACSVTSLPKKTTHENTSPNLKR